MSLFKVELGRLLRSRSSWLAIVLTALSPLAGLIFFRPIYSSSEFSYSTSLSGTIIGNPALAGAFFGSIIFAFLTASQLHRDRRTQTEPLIVAVHSSLSISAVKTLALLAAALFTQIITLIAWLPYSAIQLSAIFRLRLYLRLYLSLMLPSIAFGVLFTSAAYNITRRFDLSLVLFTAFALIPAFVWRDNWLLRWISPALSYVSDDFGNSRRIMSILYNRLFWILSLSGIWAISFLCIRRYGKGALASAARNIRKAYIPITAAVLILGGVTAYALEPFLDNSEEDFDLYAPYNVDDDCVTLLSTHVDARPDLKTGRQFGTAAYSIINPNEKEMTVSFDLNPGYKVSSATANGAAVVFRDLENDDINSKTIEADIPPDREIELVLEYGGFPKEWNIMSTFQGEAEISRDYIYLANDKFAPSLQSCLWDERPSYTATISLPEGMYPLLFGKGISEKTGQGEDGLINWKLTDTGANIILYAGDYISHHINAADIDVEFFYSEKHRRIMEECDVDSAIKNVFEYCTLHYGRLPFGDETMRLIEIGSFGGGYAGGGASAMGEDSFNEKGLRDPLKGAGGNEVLAHEIIHQWWGLGNMFDDSYENPWSSEGLTVYTTYRLMKELNGEEYAQKQYVDMWQSQVDDYYNNFYVRNPEYLEALPLTYRFSVEGGFSSMRRYCEMPLMLLKAEELVGGEEAFDEILYEIFNREQDYGNPFLGYEEFLDYCGLTEEDLSLDKNI